MAWTKSGVHDNKEKTDWEEDTMPLSLSQRFSNCKNAHSPLKENVVKHKNIHEPLGSGDSSLKNSALRNKQKPCNMKIQT